jgi:hypothetical protein
MYTTTQLLLLLFAMTGTNGPAQSHAQSRNEVAQTSTVNVLPMISDTPISTVEAQFASQNDGSHWVQETPSDCFWISRLNDWREDIAVSHENTRPMVVEMMKSDKAQQLREQTMQVQRDKAHIVYPKQVQRQTTISRLDQ